MIQLRSWSAVSSFIGKLKALDSSTALLANIASDIRNCIYLFTKLSTRNIIHAVSRVSAVCTSGQMSLQNVCLSLHAAEEARLDEGDADCFAASSCLVCVTPWGRAYNMAQARDEVFNNGYREFHVYEQRRGRSKKRKLDPDVDFRE